MKKRAYTKPELEAFIVDNEISLIMMTDEGTPPDKPPVPTASQSEGSSTIQTSSFEDNPFGN